MSIKRVLSSIICIIFTIIIAGCKKSGNNYDKITNFTYNYGSYNGGYYEYNIKNKKKKNFTAKGYNEVNLNINKEIDEYYMKYQKNYKNTHKKIVKFLKSIK